MQSRLWFYGAMTTVAALLAPMPAMAQTTTVTDVQLLTREAGTVVQIQTQGGRVPQFSETRNGNTLAIDLINTQLQLEDNDLQQANPAPGINSIEVRQRDGNTVRITLVGEQAPPTVSLMAAPQGFAFEISSEDPIVEQPPTEAPLETPPPSASEDLEPIELVVTATRTEEELEDVPRSVTVIPREQIEEQATLTSDVGDILGKLVPGFGPPNQRTTILRQSLRGRGFSVLIDGVPQSTNREFLGDLRTIDPSAIERIEIVRGPTAIYGADATGGVINIITRQAEAGEFNARTQVGTTFALDPLEDSIGYEISQSVSGNTGSLDYAVTASFESIGGFFDAEGDRIAQAFLGNNLDESDNLNLLGKLGWNIDSQQRLQLTANYFSTKQDTEFIAVATPEGEKAEAVRVGELEIEDTTGSDNTVLTLDYTHEDLLGSEVKVQAYYRDYTSRSFPSDFRDGFFGEIGRSRLESERFGGRLQIETPLTANDDLNLFWGLDYTQENTEQPFDIYDPVAFDESGGTNFVFEREGVFVPFYKLRNLGAFAQLAWNPNERLNVRGGLRYEDIHLSVDDFTTFFGSSAQGGEQNFSDVVFNIGAAFDATENINLYANFAQGFTAPDFGRILRFPEFNGIVNVSESLDITSPQKVDSYELGVRGNWGDVQTSLALFYTYSDLGLTLVRNEELDILEVVRSPKRTYGLEGTVDWQPVDNWQVGGTLTLLEGEDDRDGDGDFESLGSRDIQPMKLTAYFQNQTTPTWSNRLQLLLVGDRSVDNSSTTEDIDGYVTLDFLSKVDLGPGQLVLGIENLFDNFYFPLNSQVAGEDDAGFTPARGRTFSVNYSLNW